MANVEDGNAPAPSAASAIADRDTRSERGGMLKVRPREDDEQFDPAEYARLLDVYDNSFRNIAEGEVVKGTVLKVTPSEVVVDVGYKSEGMIALSEFLDENGEVTVQAGDIVDVLLERTEDREGYVVLSREKAEKMKIWDEVEKAYTDRKVVIGRVIERIKGGLAVDIGVRAFLPGSQIDVRPVRNLDALRGQELRMRVIKVNKKRGNIVLSRRVLLEKQREEMKKETLKNLAEGSVLKGVVKNLTDYGAFIDLGGIDGLLHITDMSWGRIGHPSERFNVGDEVRVVVLKFDPSAERVSLGLKQIQEDPWHRADEKYPVGTRVHGKVVSITDYGAFIELEQGVEGLVHVSEMSWTKRVKHPAKMLEVGKEVEAVVLDIDPKAKRIALGMKQTEANPWTLLEDKYPIGSVIKGQVRNVTDFGIFVGVEEGVDGLVHVSDISWTQRIKHPGELYKKGDEVEAVVLNIDVENERFSLGIKQLQQDPWETLSERLPVGSRVKGKVTKVADFGAFVEIEQGIEGLIHVSELKEERVDNPRDVVQEGQEVEVKIIDINTQDRKVALSMKALLHEGEDDYREYLRRQAEGSKARLGDVMASKLRK